MSEEQTPYIECQPGDLITAEKWNELQRLVKGDITSSVEEAISAIVTVPEAGDAEKLDGKTPEELLEEIIKRVLAAVNTRSGLMKLFLKLRVGDTRVVEHGLGSCPVVDAYQLKYFPVVCCEDKQTYPAWTTFYAFHSSEKKLRYTAGGERGTLEILPRSGPAFRVPFKVMLEHYGVETKGSSALSDVLTEFWKALFAAPNDEFDDNQYCHSPWFDKCCREEMSLRDIKKKGHWDDLWIQYRPCKTIHYPALDPTAVDNAQTGNDAEGNPLVHVPGFATTHVAVNAAVQFQSAFETFGDQPRISPRRDPRFDDVVQEAVMLTQAPQNLRVDQYDFDNLGVTLLRPPIYPGEFFAGDHLPPGLQALDEQVEGVRDELKVMLLLKC